MLNLRLLKKLFMQVNKIYINLIYYFYKNTSNYQYHLT